MTDMCATHNLSWPCTFENEVVTRITMATVIVRVELKRILRINNKLNGCQCGSSSRDHLL
ncbi:hypothetical protein Ciccas_004178 [Cichlidogyrus casuarinus]|uniref:Uncharacterized protein n=1 Tax=Cichlidogyrus casuarinus TaxID=1844966 RepID=A0ABD2QC81_9PLAT